MQSIFFLNYRLNYSLSGVEHASLKRMKIFNELGHDVKFLTLNYSTESFFFLNKHNISESEFVNFYKSYQCFDQYIAFTIHNVLNKVEGNDMFKVETKGDDHRVYKNSNLLMYVHCFSNSNQVSYINYFDLSGNKIRRELYDCKGYLSSEIILQNNKHVQQNYFDKNGLIYLRVNEFNGVKFYSLKDKNKDYYFDNEVDMHAYWLDKITSKNDVAFIDKNRIYNPILKKINKNKLKKISIIHSTHTSNPNDKSNKRLNSNYSFLNGNQDLFDACVVATEEQYQDLINDFDMQIPVYVIPPSYVSESRVNRELSIDPFRILSIGRIAVEKRQEDMIMAMKIVVKQIPNAKLEIFGIGTSELTEKLKKMVLTENLSEHVFFRGYSQNIADELFNAHLSLVTSKVESFCIAILDSMEQGTPVISYDIKYGPSAIIENGVNGDLVENNNIEELAYSIVKFYNYNFLEYSENTKNIFGKYSSKIIRKKWFNLLNDFMVV